MLSLALRYGTTRHIKPGKEQLEGDRENGVEPLVWRGDDVAETRALIHTFVTTFQNKAPEFKDVRYDFNRREFVGRLGKPVDRATFKREAREGAGRAGEATARRGILIQSLVSSESRERPGILEQVLNQARALVLEGNLDQSFSRQPQKATSRGGFFVSGLPRSQISAVTQAITRAWKNAPEIVIVDDMNDPAIPEAVRLENQRQLSQGASAQPEGFFADGRAYIVASQMRDSADVARVLLHESLGHYGLRGLYGEGLNKILKQVAGLRRGDVEAMAKRYGLDMKNEADRLQASEEVLAHLAQTRPESGFVQRAIAAIRAWLRENIPGFGKMKLSDGEIIEHFLLPARRFVEAGADGVTALRVAPGFSRKSATPDVDAELAGLVHTMRQVRGSGQAKAAAAEFLDKPIANIETGFVAVVTKKSLGKMMSASAWEKSVSPQAHYHAVGNIDALFRLAIQEDPPRAGTRPEDKGVIKSMRHFDVPMPYEGDVLRVQITVKEFEKPDASGHRIYTLHALKIETPAFLGTAVPRASSGLVSQNRLPTGNAGVEARFTQMVEIVKESLNTPDVSFSRSVAAQFVNAAHRAANVAPVASVAPAAPSPGGGLTPWRDRMDRIADSLIYNFQDRFKPLRDIQKRMVPAREEEDAVLAEERYSGIVRARTDDFHADLRDPLIEAIHDGKLARGKRSRNTCTPAMRPAATRPCARSIPRRRNWTNESVISLPCATSSHRNLRSGSTPSQTAAGLAQRPG